MDYSLIKDLLNYAEEFQVGHDTGSVEDFTIWLNNRLFSAREKDEHSAHDELLIAFKIMYANKELKKRTKAVLSESNVSSIDEYSFLLHLDHSESFRKMEIIDMHNLEAPTGIEIIKRLLRNKFVEEFADADDKRAKRIRITRKGVEELAEIRPKMESAFSKFTESLSLNEKVRISGMLDKLINS